MNKPLHSSPSWKRLRALSVLACAVASLLAGNTQAQDVRMFGLLKNQSFIQTNTGPAVTDGGSNHSFQAFVDTKGDGLTNVILRLPGGADVSLEDSESDGEFRRSFLSQSTLDAAFPNGVYTMILGTVNDGSRTNSLQLTGNAYPATPHFNNYSAAQAVNPAADFTLGWDALAGATTNDFVQVEVSDCTGERVFETPSPGEPGALNGTNTSLLIPARALRPGQKYQIELIVGHFVVYDTNSYPGAVGLAAYAKNTKTWLVTTGTITDCPVGRFELSFQFPMFNLGSSTQGVANFPLGLSNYTASFSVSAENDPNFPENVTFTGPGGFGWNNTTNSYGDLNGFYAWYGSTTLNSPPFPPAGIYSVNYKGTNVQFNLLDPQAAGQQVLLVPTAIVNGAGLLEEVRWVYKNTNGVTIGAQPFMAHIELRVDGFGGSSYDAGNQGKRIPPSATSHILAQPIPWSGVQQIQIGFRDVAGSRFVSWWNRPQTGLQIVTESLSPSGLGADYHRMLTASGGNPPYQWSVLSGNLPPGVALNTITGVISGAPTNSGFYGFEISVMDSMSHTSARGFVIQVGGPNSRPFISDIPPQSTPRGQTIGPIPFTIGDAESPANTLTLERNSSNQSIARNSNIVFGGGFGDRTVTITPEPNGVGTATITIIVSDGLTNSTTSFTLTVVGGDEPNVSDFMIIKGQEFMQTNAANVNAAGPSNVLFQASVSFDGLTSVTNVLLRRPNGSTSPLQPREDKQGEVELGQRFASTSAADSAFPNGTYALLLATANDGTKTNSLTLGGSYPPTPRISNFTAAQTVNPANDFTLTWDALTGVTTNDFIYLEVRDCNDRTVFETPPPGKPGVLAATNTGVVIPGRTLRPGQTYGIAIIVGRISARDTTSHPGALGLAGYFKQLLSRLSTTGIPSGCPFGDLRLSFTFRPGVFAGGTAGSTSYPQDFAFYNAHFHVENDPSHPDTILFSGPPGSSLNNTGTGYSGSDGSSAWYSSYSVNTPPYPPGGTYSVQYKDAILQHQLLDPNAASQKILLVPNIVTNGAGEVTEVNWSYRDAAGNNTGAQPFMRRLRVRLNGANGPLFPNGHEDGLSPSATNVIVDPPVSWAAVSGVQTGFEDNAGNEFLCDWLRSSPSVQIITYALPGGVISNAYNRTVSAFGGNPPYGWAVISGELPPGLTLNADTGTISGVAEATGLFNFTLRVADSSEQTDDQSYSVRITPPGPDASTYVVAKGRRFLQTNSPPPVPAVPGFQFVSFVDIGIPGAVSSATLQPPGGLLRTLTGEMDRFALEEAFTNQAALDAAFANGLYTFTIGTVNEGTLTPSLILTNNAYPAAPRIANWGPAHAVNAAENFALNWDAFSSGTTNDFIVLGVLNSENQEIFSSPGFLEPGFYDGTTVSAVIPGGTLAPATTHKARLLFVKRTALNTNGYPNVPGVAAYFAETEFTITTANPAGVLQFNAANLTVDEAIGAAIITVNRLGGTQGAVTVDYSMTDGTALGDVDYFPATGTLEFADGVTSRTFTIGIEDDLSPEGPETIHLALGNLGGGAGLGAIGEATLAILDNDAPEGPNLRYYGVAKGQAFMQTNAGASTLEAGEPHRFASFARASFPGALTSALFRNSSAVTNALADEGGGEHFEFKQTFASKSALDAAFRSGVYGFTFNTTGDGVVTPSINLGSDAYPTTPHIANWAAAQAINAFADFTLTWDAFAGGSAADFVQLSIRGTNRQDDVFMSPDLFEAGALNGTNTSVLIPGELLEPGQGYECELLFANITTLETVAYPDVPGVGGYMKRTKFMITTATPPPPQGQIQFAEATGSVSETNGVATVALVRVGGTQGEVTVLVTATNGTAASGSDFSGSTVTVAFADGQTNATYSFELIDDTTYEGPETVKLSMRNPTGGATLAGQTNAILTIIDNELPPTPGTLQFSAATYSTAEGAGSVTLTVTRTGGSLGEVTVDYATADDTATSEGDFTGGNGTLTFPNGVTSRTLTIEIDNDSIDESNEVFRVALSNPSNGASLGARTNAAVTITDDDTAGVIAFTAASYSAGELSGEATITLKRTGGAAGGVTVDYTAIEGTAGEELDFAATTGTVTFDANEGEKTFTVPIYDDTLPEGNETLTLRLSNATGSARLGALTNATLTIVDDEMVLQFSRTSFTNNEAGPSVTFTVTRTGPTTEAVTVDYATADGTALAGEDYSETTGTLTFSAGVTSRTFTVPILNDTLVEDEEFFTVELLNPGGSAQIGERDTAVVNVVDNDFGGEIFFSAVNYSAKESAPFATITVLRTDGRAGGVTVDFTVTDGTAEDGDDYTATNGTLAFEAGVTKLTFTIPLIDDSLDETNETIALALSNPTGGATLGERTEATATIIDNDTAGTVRFSATTYSASETGSVATITVLRSGGKAGGVSVDYSTANGTATNGVDYTSSTGTVTFEANEMSKTFTVPLIADAVADGNKTVLLSLANPGGGAKLATPTNATLNIVDDTANIQFASAAYTVNEGGRSVVVTVLRSGPPNGSATIRYATTNGTATAGSDYKVKTGTLSFSSSSTSQTISIPILNDTTGEGDETFSIILSDPTGPVQIGPRGTATVTITDNDLVPRAARRR